MFNLGNYLNNLIAPESLRNLQHFKDLEAKIEELQRLPHKTHKQKKEITKLNKLKLMKIYEYNSTPEEIKLTDENFPTLEEAAKIFALEQEQEEEEAAKAMLNNGNIRPLEVNGSAEVKENIAGKSKKRSKKKKKTTADQQATTSIQQLPSTSKQTVTPVVQLSTSTDSVVLPSTSAKKQTLNLQQPAIESSQLNDKTPPLIFLKSFGAWNTISCQITQLKININEFVCIDNSTAKIQTETYSDFEKLKKLFNDNKLYYTTNEDSASVKVDVMNEGNASKKRSKNKNSSTSTAATNNHESTSTLTSTNKNKSIPPIFITSLEDHVKKLNAIFSPEVNMKSFETMDTFLKVKLETWADYEKLKLIFERRGLSYEICISKQTLVEDQLSKKLDTLQLTSTSKETPAVQTNTTTSSSKKRSKKKKKKSNQQSSESSNSAGKQTSTIKSTNEETSSKKTDSKKNKSNENSSTSTSNQLVTSNKSPPPIIFKSTNNWKTVIGQITGRNIKIHPCKCLRNNLIKISPVKFTDYLALRELFEENKYEYVAYRPKEEKPLQVVIKGIPTFIPLEDIKADLLKQKFPVLNLFRINDGPVMALYLKRCEKSREIFNVKYISHIEVTVQVKRKSKGLIQCRRCQEFGHSQSVCHLPAKCVRCGEPHESHLCDKKNKEMYQAKCANCQGNHTASYRECPYFLVKQNWVEVNKEKLRNLRVIRKMCNF